MREHQAAEADAGLHVAREVGGVVPAPAGLHVRDGVGGAPRSVGWA